LEMFVVWWLVSLNISYELIVLKMVFVVVFMLCIGMNFFVGWLFLYCWVLSFVMFEFGNWVLYVFLFLVGWFGYLLVFEFV